VTSISRLLLRNLVIASFLLCAVWSAGFFLYTWNAFTQQFDSTLADEVATIVELTELNEANLEEPALPDGTRFELEFRNLVAPESEALTNARYFQLWDAFGGVVARRSLALPPAKGSARAIAEARAATSNIRRSRRSRSSTTSTTSVPARCRCGSSRRPMA